MPDHQKQKGTTKVHVSQEQQKCMDLKESFFPEKVNKLQPKKKKRKGMKRRGGGKKEAKKGEQSMLSLSPKLMG